MKFRFLCPERRRWLMQDANTAAYTRQQLQDIAGHRQGRSRGASQ